MSRHIQLHSASVFETRKHLMSFQLGSPLDLLKIRPILIIFENGQLKSAPAPESISDFPYNALVSCGDRMIRGVFMLVHEDLGRQYRGIEEKFSQLGG